MAISKDYIYSILFVISVTDILTHIIIIPVNSRYFIEISFC